MANKVVYDYDVNIRSNIFPLNCLAPWCMRLLSGVVVGLVWRRRRRRGRSLRRQTWVCCRRQRGPSTRRLSSGDPGVTYRPVPVRGGPTRPSRWWATLYMHGRGCSWQKTTERCIEKPSSSVLLMLSTDIRDCLFDDRWLTVWTQAVAAAAAVAMPLTRYVCKAKTDYLFNKSFPP